MLRTQESRYPVLVCADQPVIRTLAYPGYPCAQARPRPFPPWWYSQNRMAAEIKWTQWNVCARVKLHQEQERWGQWVMEDNPDCVTLCLVRVRTNSCLSSCLFQHQRRKDPWFQMPEGASWRVTHSPHFPAMKTRGDWLWTSYVCSWPILNPTKGDKSWNQKFKLKQYMTLQKWKFIYIF